MSFIIQKSEQGLEKLSTGRTRQWLANGALGTSNTAIIENYFEEGGFVPLHYHATEELLVCLEGHGVIIMNGEYHNFPAGSVAVITPMTVHEIRNTGKETMHMLGFFPESDPQSIWVNQKK